MSRARIYLLPLWVLAALAGCGGSSSETPFPLEPDLARLDGGPSANARIVVYGGEKKKQEGAEPALEPEAEQAKPPAK